MPTWFCMDAIGTNPCYDTSNVHVMNQTVYTNAQIDGKTAPMIIQCNRKVYTIMLGGEVYTHYYRPGSVADAICDIELSIRKNP